MIPELKKLKKELDKLHTNQLINYEHYMSILNAINKLNEDFNPDWKGTNHDINFNKQLGDGKIYENIFYQLIVNYLQEVKSQKIQWQETGNVFVETENKYSGNWEISRTGVLKDSDTTVLTFVLQRHDITNNKVSNWFIGALKEDWIHEIKRLGLEEKVIKDGKSKGYAVPLNKILWTEKDREEIKLREEKYKQQRIKELRDGRKGL